MECIMYIRFVLFSIIDTNCRGSPNGVLVLILLNEMKILDGEHRGDAIKMTCHTPCGKECGKYEGASLDHNR
jgi:hypothetical protein